MNKKIEDLISTSKLGELLHYAEKKEEKENKIVLIVFAVIGVLALLGGIVFAIYYFLLPEYEEEYDIDSFNDDELFEEDEE